VKKLLALMALFAAAALPHETLTTTVLFDREIVRILDAHCVMCHAANGLSFPLETYEQTQVRGRKIRADVIARHMPPWAAFPGYGQFANDNSLTLRETQFIVSWVEGLGPRNAGNVFLNITDAAKRPQEVRAHNDFGHWALSEPDLMRPLPATTIAARSADQIKRTVIDLGLTAERRVKAVEYMPGDYRVVRAAFFTIQETGQWIGSWTPWHSSMNLPTGAAFRLPKGSHIVAEIHYRGSAEQVSDRGTLGLHFADTRAQDQVSDLVLEGKGTQKVRATTRLSADTRIIALRPEVQPGVQSLEVAARKPDGSTEVMLFARDIPLDWPTPYIFKQPVALPRGTELSVTAYYPNTGSIRLTASTVRR